MIQAGPRLHAEGANLVTTARFPVSGLLQQV